MRAALLLAVLLWQAAGQEEAPIARPEHLRYARTISVPAGAGQACAVLDAQIFPHAAPALKDLRVFPSQYRPAQNGPPRETPYAITLSEAVSEETQPARVLNLGTAKSRGGPGTNVVFDLEMPDRAYTDVMLDLSGQDFLATATVSGMKSLNGGKLTALGVFTLFDLSSQRLSRDTTLPLVESTFRYLHVELAVSPAPGTTGSHFAPEMVAGAQVPPSREAQTIYTTVAETSSLTTVGRESRATFTVPPRVPVERISFALAPGFKGNFSRDVRVTAVSEAADKETGPGVERELGASRASDAILAGDAGRARGEAPRETVTGTILRVHANEGGREIRSEQLDVPAILGANLQRAAKVEVTLENGDDQPLPIAAVRLEMRQRKLCFEAIGDAPRSLYYGDPALLAPVYDYQRLFTPSEKPLVAQLGPEQLNPNYVPPPAEIRPFTERHPEVLWIALIAVICVLGVVALKSSRNVGVPKP